MLRKARQLELRVKHALLTVFEGIQNTAMFERKGKVG